MKGSSRNAGWGNARNTRTLKIAPTTCAIRAALAISATMLALSGSGGAFAACTATGPTDISCDGAALGPIATNLDDLTLIVGGNSPTSVTSSGVDGISMTDNLGGSETLHNYASVSTYGGGNYNAIDVVAYSDVTVVNGGPIEAYVTLLTGNPNAVTALTAYSYAGNISIDNQATGSITATADSGIATGIYAVANGYGNAYPDYSNVEISNSGSISAYAADNDATGIYAAAGGGGDVTIDNTSTGSISATAHTQYGYVTATGTASRGVNVTVNNDGVITADAYAIVGQTLAIGVENIANEFSTLYNGVDGNISATATTGTGVYYYAIDAAAYGAFVTGSSALITNHGSISAEATANYNGPIVKAVGAETYGLGGFATSVNYGDISAVATSSSTQFSKAYATGVVASTTPYSAKYATSTSVNHGDISAQATLGLGFAHATGVHTYAAYAASYNYEGGTVTAIAEVGLGGRSYAIGVESNGKYYTHDVNSGTISAYASVQGSQYYGNASATGVHECAGIVGADGFCLVGFAERHALLENSGDISAMAIAENVDSVLYDGALATGVYQASLYGEIHNSGDIAAIAGTNVGSASAVGINQRGSYGAYLGNDLGGSINATASSDSVDGDYYGGRAYAKGTRIYSSVIGIEYNDGEITASATAYASDIEHLGGLAKAYGSIIFVGGNADIPHITEAMLVNAGGIHADAIADFGVATAYGSQVTGGYSSSTLNSGSISASASAAQGYAIAVGSYTNAPEQITPHKGACYSYTYYQGYGNVCTGGYAYTLTSAGGFSELENHGHILADASAFEGVSYAYGSIAVGKLTATTFNDGAIRANASAEGGLAVAVGSLTNAFYGTATLTNAGDISAEASGDDAEATGASVIGTYGTYDADGNAATVDNSGSISAVADGAVTSIATGVAAISTTDDSVHVLNEAGGEISAAAYGPDASATGVTLYSNQGLNALRNYGQIIALGDGDRIAVYSNSSAVADIVNHGTLTGSIQTGNYNDSVLNYGHWNAIQGSYLGAGDDSIGNEVGGTIDMDDASIYLGAYVYGNSFVNAGTITANGSDNVINMGYSVTLVPGNFSNNPNAFQNNGLIDFQDGAANDVLTIVGDFTGEGRINLDVSGLLGVSDMLHIYGNVVDGTVNTINLDLLDQPTAPSSQIELVTVSGDSVAGNFVLGTVNYSQANFLSLGFSLTSLIDGTNASNDAFSLGVHVTGMSDPGTIGAAIAPGAQSLMNSLAGSWHQRIGVIDQYDKGGVSLWGRVFQSNGKIRPDHVASNFGQDGNFDFDQKNSGAEVGADFAVTDEFSLGLMASRSEGKQNLSSPGVGSDRIKADTYGLYGTWIAPSQLYLDVSYRWMRFSADLSSLAGSMSADGDATSFNVEIGYAWTLSNAWKVEPQFQYTRTAVKSIDALSGPLADFRSENGKSSVGRLGVMFRKDYQSTAGGVVWTPYGSINAVREFDGENRYSINGDFFGDTRTKGTSALLELGVNGQLSPKLAFYAGLNYQDGGTLSSFFGGQLGLRYTFGQAVAAPPPTKPLRP